VPNDSQRGRAVRDCFERGKNFAGLGHEVTSRVEACRVPLQCRRGMTVPKVNRPRRRGCARRRSAAKDLRTAFRKERCWIDRLRLPRERSLLLLAGDERTPPHGLAKDRLGNLGTPNDHRHADGAELGLALPAFRAYLEDPARFEPSLERTGPLLRVVDGSARRQERLNDRAGGGLVCVLLRR
jgi:hypothetical protein